MENLVVNRDFWKTKNVLVTGHTGFKGSWLSLWLQDMGAAVSGYSLPAPTQPSMFERADIALGMNSIAGDVRDYQAVQRTVDETNPDIVLHLAAQSLVRPSYADPLETYSTNVMGTANILEAVRQSGRRQDSRIQSVVIVTSDKCYENKEVARGYKETDRLGGHDPYSNSKGCAELVASAFRKSYFSEKDAGIRVATVRAGNVIGGGDWSRERLVPDAMKAFVEGDTLRIRNPAAIRPWQHVLDPLWGYLRLCEKLHAGGTGFAKGWNFGPDSDSEQPVSEVVRLLADEWGENAIWDLDKGPHPHEAAYLKLDSSCARADLDWKPRMNLIQAIEKTVSWYKRDLELESMRDFSIDQIGEFENTRAVG